MNNFLSERGKKLYIPHTGVIAQSKRLKSAVYNATLGIMYNERQELSSYTYADSYIKLPREDIFNYSPPSGIAELRLLWQQELLRNNPSINFPISCPIITSGLTNAFTTSIYLFADTTTTILLPTPCWENYQHILNCQGVHNTYKYEILDGNRFDLISFKEALNKVAETGVIIFNFPNNPTGYMPTKREVDKIQDLLLEQATNGKKLVLLLDDAYSYFTFGSDTFKESLFSIIGNLHENILAVKLDSASKEEAAWGLRLGFITLSSKGLQQNDFEAYYEKIASYTRGTISNNSTLGQSLLIKLLLHPDHTKEKKIRYLEMMRRFEVLKGIITNKSDTYSKHFKFLPSTSGYFCSLKLNKPQISNELQTELMARNSIGIILMGGLLRIALSSLREKDIEYVLETIYTTCELLSD